MVRVRAGEKVSGFPEISDYEWLLTSKLLEKGYRKEWAVDYVSDKDPNADESFHSISKKFATHFKATDEDVHDVYRTVCNNAFALDTCILRLNFGAAFFSKAAYFNHRFVLELCMCMSVCSLYSSSSSSST